jgi:signal transduction histidine kinase
MNASTDSLSLNAIRPGRLFVIMLLLVFAVEGAIMVALPWFPRWARSHLIEGLSDAALLTLVMAPALWWLAVRPLQQIFQARGQLLHELFNVQEQERTRIARDLHDEIGQHLTALLVGLKTIEAATDLDTAKRRADQLRELTSKAHLEVRRLARGLRPDVLEELHLEAAIERLCEDFQEIHRIAVRLEIEPGAGQGLTTTVETSLYRILQEALTNAARHASATAIEVWLDRGENGITLRVADNGLGFAVQEANHSAGASGKIGLASIRERAVLLGGECRVLSGKGTGTAIQVTVPAVDPNHGEDSRTDRG